MLEGLGKALKKATDKVANAIFLDKNVLDSIIRDLQRAMIEADINILLVKQISDKIRKEAMDERIKEIDKKEHIIKLLHDELVKILGEYKPLELKKGQNRILLLGLYGAGKTTTIAKLGNYFQKRGKKVALVGLDVHRPAAKEQLLQLGERNNLKVFVNLEENDTVKTYKNFKKELEKFDLVLIDTAGRHNLDKELIKEIEELGKTVNPTETILIMPADIGQAAKAQVDEFLKALSITGVIITRMDSTAKAGGALTACAETKSGIYFICNGEKINDIEEFNPDNFLSRLLGMGDLASLIEKVKSASGEKDSEEMQKRMLEGKISLDDVIEQVKSMNSIGGFDKIKSMIPGLGNAKIPEGAMESQQEKISKWEHIIKSLTKQEKEDPEILLKETSRIRRVATGAGVNTSEVRALLKQYKMLSDMIKENANMDLEKGFSQRDMQKMMRKFSKMGKIKF
jgi:signal recognition particle subunit SRP54